MLGFEFSHLGRHPELQLLDGLAFGGKLDVGVAAVDIVAGRMAHQGPSHVGNDAGFHQPGRERVAQVVKPKPAHARTFERPPPSRLHQVNGLFVIGKQVPFGLVLVAQVLRHTVGKRNLSRLARDGLGLGDLEQLPVQIYVFPSLVQQLPAPHSRVERHHDDRAEVLGAGSEKQWFLPDA